MRHVGLIVVLGLALVPHFGDADFSYDLGDSAGDQACSDGVTVGVDGNGVVCCPTGCSQCGGLGCGAAGDDCCGGPIVASRVYCQKGINDAPCILGSPPPPSPPPSPYRPRRAVTTSLSAWTATASSAAQPAVPSAAV
ncbi:unnamed protein product [Pylaiella littoralis]